MQSGRQKRVEWRAGASVVFLGGLLAGWTMDRIPLPIVAGYVAMSVVAFTLYRRDKRAAQGGDRRTRERTLHLADLLGGWPGGLLAQGRLRHKTRKTAFQLVFWATVLVHGAVLAWSLGADRSVRLAPAADGDADAARG